MSTGHTTPTNQQSQTGIESEGEFEEGLRTIIDNCQEQLGRPLTADELAGITRQARSFFDSQGQHLDAPDDSARNPASNESDQQQHPVELGQAVQQGEDEGISKPPYPPNFYELAKLISSSAHGDNPTDLLKSLLSQKNLSLDGLKTIPNKLNDQKPSSPVLATQTGAGKKPWQTAPDLSET